MSESRKTIYYAGIGSRETPLDICSKMNELAGWLNNQPHKFVLRSGGAEGADTAFAAGAQFSEIYLPWKGFNGSESTLYPPSEKAIEMAIKFHPRFDYLSRGAKLLMSRNSHQIFGKEMNDPVSFVVCWTKDGKASGGTGQALRIAQHYDIKVFNLFFPEAEEDLKAYVTSL